MLYLISMGLNSEKDMSLRAIETAKKCHALYAEFYTNRIDTSTERLGKKIGKKVVEIGRGDLEEGSVKILGEARENNVGILVGGDALFATTHISLLMDAKKMGVETRVIHGSSIYSAVGETGLQLYNFGKTTTLAFPDRGFHPESAYDVIEKNQREGMHTLVLLDTKKGGMSTREGLRILLKLEDGKRKGILDRETKLVACCNIGGESVIRYGEIGNLEKDRNLRKTPAVLIIPGKLHFLEKEFLETL